MDKFQRLHLREWRLFKGLNGQQLADLSGITRSEVSRLEHGSRRLTMNHAKLLADAMGINPEDLTRLPESGIANVGSFRIAKGERPEFRVMVAGARFQTDDPIRFVPTPSDEMRPTFMPGDYVAVDTSAARFSGAGVYLVKLDGIESIRRVQLTGRMAKISCDNERYDAVEKAADKLEIIAKAVAVIKPV